jgi:hypothetical protein
LVGGIHSTDRLCETATARALDALTTLTPPFASGFRKPVTFSGEAMPESRRPEPNTSPLANDRRCVRQKCKAAAAGAVDAAEGTVDEGAVGSMEAFASTGV